MEIAVADPPRRRGVRTVSAVLGVVVAVGVFLPWASNSQGSIVVGVGSLDQRLSGFEWIPGWVALAGAGLMLLAALVGGTRFGRLLLALGGLAALAAAAWALIATRAFYLTVASFTLAGGDFSRSDVRTQVERILDDFELAVRPGIGAWIVAGGGLVAILAAIFLRGPRQPQRTLEAPDEPHTAEPQREESVALEGTSAPRFPLEEPTRSDEEPDRTSPQDVKGSVWERSFDDAERTVDRIEDQPAAPPGADPEEDHTAGEAEEPPGPQRKRRAWGQLGRLAAS